MHQQNSYHYKPIAPEGFQLLLPGTVTDAVAVLALLAASASYFLAGYTWNRPDPYRYIWYQRPQLQDGASGSTTQRTRDISKRLEELVRCSQTNSAI